MLSAAEHRYCSVAELVEDYHERGWTDGLPITPPTPEAVRGCLSHAGLAGHERVGSVASWSATVTAEHVAINAVMAGCRPVDLTTVIAAVRALTEPEANCWTNCATTNNPSQVIVVNGPVRQRVGVRCRTGLLGPGNRASATIGRAVGLVVRNVLGAVPGGIDQSVFSFPGRYSICFGENEEGSPWTPLHVERGLAPEQSAVTVLGAMPMLLVRPSLTAGPDEIVADCAAQLQGSVGVWGRRRNPGISLLVVVAAEHMGTLARAGWTKADLRQALFGALSELRGGVTTRDDGLPLALSGPGAILVVAAGGSGNPLSMLFPPLAGAAVTVPVTEGGT
jgi:hypothetical protein